MADRTNKLGKFGPLKVELVNDDAFDFYRFFHRRNNNNDNVYSLSTDFIVMKHLDINEKRFRNYSSLYNCLENVISNNVNVTNDDILLIKNSIIENFTDDYSCLEIILPIKNNNRYSQEDIDNVYNTILDTLVSISAI